MLHKINLPDCTTHLDWVVKFQGDLLRALCRADVGVDNVCVDWVKAQRQDIDGIWVKRFCRWSRDGNSVLDRMRAIAGLPDATKQTLVAHYETNLRYPEAFEPAAPAPPAVNPLPGALSDIAEKAYRNFFKLFYDPIFYRENGYPIHTPDLNGQPFTRAEYLNAYDHANPNVKVCPLCDGSMDGAELDHWLAKKHLPELNCHPQNLVRICHACNSRANKGEKLALDQGQVDPFENWFHPYLRSAAGVFRIAIERGAPKVVSSDPTAQARLDKLNSLINLTKRWTTEWRLQFKRIEARIRRHRQCGKAYDVPRLKEQLEAWGIDAAAEKGIGGYKLLETELLSIAMDPSSDAFAEFLGYAEQS